MSIDYPTKHLSIWLKPPDIGSSEIFSFIGRINDYLQRLLNLFILINPDFRSSPEVTKKSIGLVL